MTLREKIEASPLFQSGNTFRPIDMANSVKEDRRQVTAVINDLRERGLVAYDGRVYWRPRIHWLNKRRLAAPVHDPRRDVR
jgi:hypothetical protein